MIAFAALLAFVACGNAHAFSQAGHMVTGAIVFEELRARSPQELDRLVELMTQHPDRGSFEVAMDRSVGDDRTLKLLMEMARWPDDIRRTIYDHPTWHYASKPLPDARHPSDRPLPDRAAGSAVQAFALNLSVAGDSRAPAPERALALCWILHLVGDIHQPLHAADRYSAEHPTGDHGGGLAFILDPQGRGPISLHWYWDQAVNRSSDAAPGRALALLRAYPRRRFPQLAPSGDDANFVAWAAESFALARSDAYRADLDSGATEALAVALTPEYVANSTRVAERQLTLASYRLADLLADILR